MRIRLWRVVLAAALALAGGAVHAGQCDGVSFPDHVTVGGQVLALNGLGIRKATFFRIKVYVAALYLARRSSDAAAILSHDESSEIALHFLWHVTTDELRGAWREGFARSAKGRLAPLRSRIATLDGWMHGVDSGQTMTFVHVRGQGIEYLLDGVKQGTIPGADFARAFLGIWLGTRPPGKALKAGLLGGRCQ